MTKRKGLHITALVPAFLVLPDLLRHVLFSVDPDDSRIHSSFTGNEPDTHIVADLIQYGMNLISK